MRIQPGQAAPDFTLEDIFGNSVSLQALRGKKILLSFYRYASCPLCNLRIHELIQHHQQLQKNGLEVIAVFQSSVDSIRAYVGKQDAPFPIIADPDQLLYRRYGVTPSWWKFTKAVMRMKEIFHSFRLGYLPGKIDGDLTMVPADFLLDKHLNISIAYYGSDIGDHLSFADIQHWISENS